MGNFVYNISKGRVGEYGVRVNNNDPTNSIFIMVVVNSTETDATLQDLDDMSVIESNANTAEVGNTNYARKTFDQAAGMTSVQDDSANVWNVDIPDQTWTAVAAGTAWTDIIMLYLADSTGGTGAANNANQKPMTQHDFAVTPDGSDITAQVAAGGFYQAA